MLNKTDSKYLKERMKIIVNTFLTHRKMGEAEAVYTLLPSMLLKIKCSLPVGILRNQRRNILKMEKRYRGKPRVRKTTLHDSGTQSI